MSSNSTITSVIFSTDGKKRCTSPRSSHFQEGLIVEHQQNKKAKNTTTQKDEPPSHNFISRIKVNGIIYHINANKLKELEPDTILIRWDAAEFSTKHNLFEDAIEYLDPIDNFQIIIDYIKGYELSTVLEPLRVGNLHLNIAKIITTIKRLKMNNLLEQVNALYPKIIIDGKELTLSIELMATLEPHNMVMLKVQNINGKYHLFRDYKIFTEILHPYLTATKTIADTFIEIRNTKTKDITEFNKICDDLRYFNLVEMWKKIKTNKMC